jgi:protein arginine kinase activator
MMCELCKKNAATVFLTQIVEGKMKKVDLCEPCSKEKGLDDTPGFALADLLMGVAQKEPVPEAPLVEAVVKCPTCGFTQEDFKKSSRLGCSECYAAFGQGLETLLKGMHKGTRHVGKIPGTAQRVKDPTERLKALQRRLEKSVAEENFEQAAGLRDEIRQLKQASKNPPPAAPAP